MAILKDASGRRVGEIKEISNGNQVAYDANGRKVGEYFESENLTKDAHGRRVGQGNLLASLL